jgi:hypothetical protein
MHLLSGQHQSPPYSGVERSVVVDDVNNPGQHFTPCHTRGAVTLRGILSRRT